MMLVLAYKAKLNKGATRPAEFFGIALNPRLKLQTETLNSHV